MCGREGVNLISLENGFLAEIATSDLIPKESAGSDPYQNNSEGSITAQPCSQVPKRLMGRSPPLQPSSRTALCREGQ